MAKKEQNKQPKMAGLSIVILADIGSSAVGKTGYDLTKDLALAWNASHQQVYRELTKLHDGGYLKCVLEPQAGKPDRKIYTLLPTGRDLLNTLTEQEHTVEDFYRHASHANFAISNVEYFQDLIYALGKKLDQYKADLKEHEINQKQAARNSNIRAGIFTPLSLFVIQRQQLMCQAEIDAALIALKMLKAQN